MIESKGYKITPIDGDLAVSRNAEIGRDVDIHGKARVAGSLKVEGFLDAPHIKGAAKGLFNSVEELTREYPDPRPGWFAIVLDATNKEKGILYKAENGGWVATTDEAKPYEFIKDSINVFASKGELADETQRAQSAEHLLTQRIVNETVRATEAENGIKKDAVKFSRLGITGYADKLELMAGTIDGDEVRYIDIPAATETKAGVVSAADKKHFVKPITWNNDTDPSNMNDFVVAGVYEIKSERTRDNDNLPILNIGGGHSFNARLTVLDSSIVRTEGEPQSDDKCVTQVLSFSNRLGQGEVYIRTGKGSSLNNLSWENWSTLQRNVNVDTVTSLDHIVDNGIYSGVYEKNDAVKETFVMVVINNYALAGNNFPKSISQFKYSVSLGGSFAKYETRVGTGMNDWGEWEILNKDEITSMISAEIEKVTDGIDPKEIDSIKDIVAWINAHGGEVTAIYNAITAESQRAQAMEQQLQDWMDADKQESQAADAEIKANAMQYNTLGVNVYADKAEIYGRSIDGKPRTMDFPAATTEEAGVMSAEDKKTLSNVPNTIKDAISEEAKATDVKIAKEKTRAEQVEQTIDLKLDEEIKRSVAADQDLLSSIDEEARRATQAEGEIKQNTIAVDSMSYSTTTDDVSLEFETLDGKSGGITFPAATTEEAGGMSAEDKNKLAIGNSYVINGANTLQDAINALNNIIPGADKRSGVMVTYTDSNNVVHTYTFMSDKGFTNPTRWKSDVVNPYIDSEQPVGFAFRLSDIIDYIKVTVTGDVDTDSVYRFGVCGYFTSADRHELQVLKDGEVLGYLYLDSATLTGTLAAGNFIIEAKVNTLDFTNGGTVYDYSRYHNRINPQLFINAKLNWETGAQTDAIAMLESKNVAVVNEIKNIEETIFEKEKEDVNVTYKGGYYSINGAYREDAQRCCTDKIDVVPGEKYFVTVNIGGSGVISYLAQWNNDSWVGIADDFKANSGNAVEREYVVPDGVTHIAVCSYNTTPPTLTKQVVGDSTTFYTKDEIYTKDEVRQLLGDDSAVKVYGVRNNLADSSLTQWERIGDAVGMVASVEKHNVAAGKDDFLDVYPFNAIRECNIETLDNGATKITYKDEEGFSLTEKDVFVEFPLWYERRYIKDGYEYREICAQQAGGFYPSPMFIEGGRVLDRVYIAKYETSLVDGIVCSKSGKEPLSYKTVAEFRELYKAKGSGYAGMDIRTVMSLQHLYLVRFAQKNTQNYIGGGYTDLFQPWGYAAKDYSGTVGGEVMVKNYVKTYPANSTFGDLTKVHWVGKKIGFVKSNESSLYDRATITDMVVSEDGKQYTIYFDKDVEIITEAAGSPANSDSSPVRTWFGGCGQDTGTTDSLVHDTGSTALAVANNKGSCAVKLFGLENMWGNVWHELDGIIFKGEYAFIGFSQKDYNNNADGYIPIAHQMLEQATLGSVGAQFCFIGNMWIDNAYPWIAYPASVRGGTPSDTTRYTDGVNENSSYGDAYYFDSGANGGVSVEVHGGGFDHYERAGFFCHRCWNGINHKWYLQGSRMQFKMI